MVFPNGSIKIIDRAKNIFKLAQGEYIAPEKLENVYTTSPYIAQIFVHGESTEAWLLAVCVAEKSEVKKLALEKGWITDGQDVSEILTKPELHQAILANFGELAKSNKLSGLEKIKKIHLIDEPFSMENDLLTPTFKIKRNVAKNKYKDQIAAIYKAGPA
jgi:long-chain acyl-CoA synthetase